MFATPAMANTPTVINTPGGDDSSYQIPLSSPVMFFGQQYNSIWATTNAVITFGSPDGTFHDFPMTPSISLGSQDWEAYAGRAGEQFVISYTDTSFQVDMIARPFGSGTGVSPSRLVLTGIINQDRTINFSYYLENTDQYTNLRFGVRTPQGQVLSLEEANFQEAESAPTTGGEIVAPEPSSSPTVSPETTESSTVSPEPTESPTVSPTVSPEPPFLNAPTNVRVQQLPEGNVEILWDAPEQSNAQVERYAISWQNSNGGWGVASTETNIYLSREIFSSSGGLDVTYSFTVRSDNDTLPVYSQQSSPVYLFVSSVSAPEPEPEVSESPTVSPEPTESPVTPVDPNRIELLVNEGDFIGYVAPEGYRIARVESASYGADNGCHAENSLTIVQSFVTETSLSISADNSVFGDPCGGTYKRLSVVLIIEQVQAGEPTSSSSTVSESAQTESPTQSPQPEPSQSPEPSQEPTQSASPTPLPTETSTPMPTPSPEPSPELTQPPAVEPSPTPSPEPEPSPVPVEPTPTPTPEPTPSPTTTPSPTPTEQPKPKPTETPQPSATPSPSPLLPAPSATATPSPTPTQTSNPTPSPTPIVPETPVAVEIKTPVTAENISAVVAELATVQPQLLTQEQQVVIKDAAIEALSTAEQGSAEYEAALDALLIVAQADDMVLDEELAAIPLIGNVAGAAVEVFNALGNAGADMSPQVREQSEKVVIAAVIVGQVAMTATAAAASAAVAARRP